MRPKTGTHDQYCAYFDTMKTPVVSFHALLYPYNTNIFSKIDEK